MEKPLSFESGINAGRVKVEILSWDSFCLLFEVPKTKSFKVFPRLSANIGGGIYYHSLLVRNYCMMLRCASKPIQLSVPVCFDSWSRLTFSSLITAPIYSLYHNHLLPYFVSLPLVPATLQCYIFGRQSRFNYKQKCLLRMEMVQDYVKKRSFPFWGKTPFPDLFSLLEMLFPLCYPTHLQKIQC